jgi:hypothetical protein
MYSNHAPFPRTAAVEDLFSLPQAGMTTLRESGLRVLFEGKTSIEEVAGGIMLKDEG